MPKRVTFTITAILERQDGPAVPADDVLQALTDALEDIEVYVEDPDRDPESRFDVSVVTVVYPKDAPARM
ncbi:hypothetical protein [Streptomyces xanthii]|uniref:Uncharacterized protein n=1 Tax=Streptomyces xanthii TaxID=2768069 RepID=A0A7H1BL58_9ACTN|nr:hypothetical protein [Streptomyces xanthii]QNS09463.1 hypothetical protein IAG42_37535 [Streptomyces xanthii]